MNFKRYHVSRNLLNPEEVLLNKTFDTTITPPSIVNSNIYNCSNYIPVTASHYLRIYNNIAIGNYYFEFDSNKNFLRSKSPGIGVPMNISEDASYIIFNFENTYDINKYMLAETETVIPYEPYSSEVWHDIPHYIHNTSTDTLTTLPADIYANDTTATVGLTGNMLQNGTPSPSNPVDIVGVGERTGNLTTLTEVTHDGYVKILTPTDSHLFDNIEYDTEYTLSWEITSTSTSSVYNQIRFLRSNSTSVKEISNGGSFTLTSTEMSEIVSIAFYFGRNNTNGRMYNFMLNTGSTPLPYEPSGFKIPISSANTTTPVYLGEVQSTRRIKQLVLTGEKGWNINTSGSLPFFFVSLSDVAISGTEVICTHYSNANIGQSTTEIGVGLAGNAQLRVRPDNPSSYTLDTWKYWLAANQPVVYYVLATPETAVVNEPLRKIGDYADEVSGITIPTIAGANTLSVDTTLQPSEVSVNYHGWHPVADVHERESGQWD